MLGAVVAEYIQSIGDQNGLNTQYRFIASKLKTNAV